MKVRCYNKDSCLWKKIISMDNLELAYKKARKGKRNRNEVALFELEREFELIQLQQDLISGQWQPSPYKHCTIYERKPRVISVAAFRDRVLHHAIMNVVEPVLDNLMIDDSYACRKNKGVHRAVDRYQSLAKKHPYCLKIDISKYFPSIDHEILKSKVRPVLSEEPILNIIDEVIDSVEHPQASRFYFEGDDLFTPFERKQGIPIGNLTSQIFANWYLNEFDHWVSSAYRGYIRYVDDMFVFSDTKQKLQEFIVTAEEKLAQLRLKLHPLKRHLFPTRCKVDVLGYQVSPAKRWLRNDNGYRACQRLKKMAKKFQRNEMDLTDIHSSVSAWIGHAQHGETLGLRKEVLSKVRFIRG